MTTRTQGGTLRPKGFAAGRVVGGVEELVATLPQDDPLRVQRAGLGLERNVLAPILHFERADARVKEHAIFFPDGAPGGFGTCYALPLIMHVPEQLLQAPWGASKGGCTGAPPAATHAQALPAASLLRRVGRKRLLPLVSPHAGEVLYATRLLREFCQYSEGNPSSHIVDRETGEKWGVYWPQASHCGEREGC